MVCQWLVRRGLANDVEEVSIDYRHRRGLHDNCILDASVAADNCGNGDGNEAVGVYVSMKVRNVQPVEVGELKNLVHELALITKWIGAGRPNQRRKDGSCDNSKNSFSHRSPSNGSSLKSISPGISKSSSSIGMFPSIPLNIIRALLGVPLADHKTLIHFRGMKVSGDK